MAATAIHAFLSGPAGLADTEVQKCFYELRRSVDQKGRPSSITQGGIITVEIVSSDGDGGLADWMTNSFDDGQSGKIEFQGIDEAVIKTVEFKRARCIGYSERFDKTPDASQPDKPAMTLTLTMSAEDITISGATHKNNWDDKR
ncbi:type VI secretion system tube protein TssD [Spirosoma flavus]